MCGDGNIWGEMICVACQCGKVELCADVTGAIVGCGRFWVYSACVLGIDAAGGFK